MTIIKQEKKSKYSIGHHQELITNTWIEIDASALEHNIAQYKSVLNPAKLAPVIKSNAYGHGIEIIAKLFDQNADVDFMCVVSLSEALYLRTSGIKKPLLVLSILDGNLEDAIVHDIDVVVYDMNAANELSRLGKLHNKKAKIHIKVDTGLSRLGLLDNALPSIEHIYQLPFIYIHGIFTHYASSENEDQTFTKYQLEKFNFIIDHLESKGIVIPIKHTACSAAITANIDSHHTMARVGIGIYGLWPSDANKVLTQKNYPQFSIKPVLSWKTRVIQIKEIPTGSYVGYDLTYKTKQTTQIATIPIGYWDGYDRRLSNKGHVVINGHIVPIVGIVAMNLTMVNVTGLSVSVGDEVTLLGDLAGITANDIAKHCGTINYEIVTRINPLSSRIIKP